MLKRFLSTRMKGSRENDIPAAVGTLQTMGGSVLCIQWSLVDFKIPLPVGSGGVLAKSPTFRMKGATWSIELSFSNYVTDEKGVFVSLRRHQSVVASQSISYQIVVKRFAHITGGYVGKKCVGENDAVCGFIADLKKFLSPICCDVIILCRFYGVVECQTSVDISKNVSEQEKNSRKNVEGTDILLSQMKNLFLTRENSDFVIRVKDREFQVHRAILSARSPVLAAMMQHDMTEKNTSVTEVIDCEPDIFEKFLLYLYVGRVEELSWENAIPLYTLGDKYDLEHLRKDCVKYMEHNMCIDAFCDAITLGVRHDLSTLVKSAEEFFLKNVTEILLTSKWQLLMKDHPVFCNELYIKHASTKK